MFRLVDWERVTDVSKYHILFVFTVKFGFILFHVLDPECKGPTFRKMSVTSHQSTQRIIAEDLKLANTFFINLRLVRHPIAIKR
jgi:hypothetical protein